MKFVKTLAAALAILALQAVQAETITFSSAAIPAGTFYAPVFTTTDPLNSFVGVNGLGTYLSTSNLGNSTVALNGASSVSFLWYSPDNQNTVTIDGQSFTGNQFFSGGNWETFSSDTGMQSITFTTPGHCCFEIAFNNDSISAPATAAVPEPSTYALLTAGLGLVGYSARRRR